MRSVGRAAVAVAVALSFSRPAASADTAPSVAVPAPDLSDLPGPVVVDSFHLPDSVFKDLGVTLADNSASLPTGDFALALKDFDSEEHQLPRDWTGGIAVRQPRWPQPPPSDTLRGVRNWDSPYAKKFLRGVVIVTGTEIASGIVLALLPREF